MDKAHMLTDVLLDEMEKELTAIYTRAQEELQEKANAFFKKFAAEDAQKRELVKKGKMTQAQYKAWLKKKVMTGREYTYMRQQCAEQLLHVNEIATAYINGQLPYVYSINYNQINTNLKSLKGYSFHLLSPETVKAMAGRSSSFLPYKALDPTKDIPWNMKAINAEVLQGIIQGESVKDISKRIFGYTTHTGKNIGEILRKNQVAAVRSARTLVTAAENKGRQDSYDRVTKDGVILRKKWLATLDKRVRDSHLELHGETVEENKPFGNGLMYPADPSGPPEEVYNCRCSMAAVVVGFKKVTA